MGRWSEVPSTPVGLHLVANREHAGAPLDRIEQTLPRDLGGWASRVGGTSGTALVRAQGEIDLVLAASAGPSRRRAALAALRAVRAAREGLSAADRARVEHRLILKDRQLCRAIWLSDYGAPTLSHSPEVASPGAALRARLSHIPADARVEYRAPQGFAAGQAPGTFVVDADAPVGSSWDRDFDPMGFEASFAAIVRWTAEDLPLEVAVAAPPPPIAGPATVPIRYPHVEFLLGPAPAPLAPPGPNCVVPRGRVAYFGGGSDRCGAWLREAGFAVAELDDPAALAAGGFATALIGVRAFELRERLRENLAAFHDFVRAGGNLVTLYHRPGAWWDPNATPLARIDIGSPSIRWRACEPDAPVRVLRENHPLLRGPNAIGLADWTGWRRERGLYFAREWDPAFEALIETADRGEPMLSGALLSGRFGRGRHTHAALALTGEIELGTLGAARLMCNLLAPADGVA